MSSISNWKYTPHIITALFVVLTLVMVWFISLAFHTYSGLWTTNSYEKGLDFAQINKDSLPAKAYPYNVRIDYDGTKFNVAYIGFDTQQIKTIKAYVMQPTHSEKDQEIDFQSSSLNNATSQTIKLSNGLWEIRLQIQLIDNQKYYFAKKLLIE